MFVTGVRQHLETNGLLTTQSHRGYNRRLRYTLVSHVKYEVVIRDERSVNAGL